MSSKCPVASRAGVLGRAIAVGLLGSALLAGCQRADEIAVAEPATPAPGGTPEVVIPEGPTAPTPSELMSEADADADAESATVGGDGSEIRLDPLGEADLTGLDGELACSFAVDDQSPLLLARGNVGSDQGAQGVVKVAGYVERVTAPGGFDGMLDNPTFRGQGKTVRIETTGEAIGGGESPPRPATLTYLRADGASRNFEGQWRCGP
ncbi:hypothetical protein CMZ84_05635 [Lysobacteraceae bacterium NML93-0399]|nr:hypothetical protein CMZ84_05635 [Xanthomonadaceae bacterium NML93-0399]